MDISFDPLKRALTLQNRGLDFADAALVFAGRTVTWQDTRLAYGEERFITAGYLHGRCVVMVRTKRENARRVISMKHVHAREEALYFPRLA